MSLPEQMLRRARGLAALALLMSGCASARPMPEVDLERPGWTVWTGQAVWQPAGDRPRVAGELIAARHTTGDVLVSFAKPPLPIFTAQIAGRRWRLDITGRRSFGGSRRPPGRFVWFRLPDVLEGGPGPRGWRVERPAADEVVLRHPSRGEWIRVVLDP